MSLKKEAELSGLNSEFNLLFKKYNPIIQKS